MKTHDKLLQQIANTLLVNAQLFPVAGLFNGQLGVALFFYRYARYCGRRFYSGYSDEVMDAVISSVNASTPSDFGSGLAGIGWTIDYLMKNGFVETDESMFEDIDAAIEKITLEDVIAELHSDVPLFSKGLYSLTRGRREMILDCIHLCEELLGKKEEGVPPNYLNSILYFLTGAYEMGIETELCEKLLPETVSRTESSLRKSRDEKVDLFVLERQIERISRLFPGAGQRLRSGEQTKTDQETMIRACWSDTIYGFPPAPEITAGEMEDFTDRAMREIEAKNLTFHGGLAGLGLSLIKTSEDI